MRGDASVKEGAIPQPHEAHCVKNVAGTEPTFFRYVARADVLQRLPYCKAEAGI